MKGFFQLLTWVVFMTCLTLPALSQVTIGSNNPPDGSAVLDLQSNSKGFLLPRLTTTQRNAIVNPAAGLEIYNTTTACIEAYFPAGWRTLECNCNVFPNAQFTYSPLSPGLNQTVSFSGPNGGTIYAWTFASGSPASSSAQNPTVTWSSAGTFAVTLQVTDANGCSATFTDNITVINCPAPGANSVTFNYSGSPTTWTVPPGICSIQIDARGAQGANGNGGNGGLGAKMVGLFSVTPGQVINIRVGQQGLNNNSSGGHSGQSVGGGGGTYVTSNGNILVIAGGGGGGGAVNGGLPGSDQTSGGTGLGPGGASGGTNGNGGSANGGMNSGRGGGGYNTDGGAPPGDSAVGGPGASFTNGSSGGSNGAHAGGGGYGGGGGGGNYGGGGGGGYSGGGGGSSNGYGGGGGGSINNGSNPTNTSGSQSGNGQVIITY